MAGQSFTVSVIYPTEMRKNLAGGFLLCTWHSRHGGSSLYEWPEPAPGSSDKSREQFDFKDQSSAVKFFEQTKEMLLAGLGPNGNGMEFDVSITPHVVEPFKGIVGSGK